MKFVTRTLIVPMLFLLAWSLPADAEFWDPGAIAGAARSDFNSPWTGTYWDPIWIGETSITSARYYWWPRSNWMSFGDTSNGYWVFHANDEPVAGWKDASNGLPDGPPGQTHAIGTPGQHGYGFHYAHINEPANPQNNGLHILINTDLLSPAQRQEWSEMPFLSIGAEQYRGNNGVPPAVLNADPLPSPPPPYPTHDVLRFNLRLWESSDGVDGATYRHAGMYFRAKWGGVNRMLFIDFHEAGGSVYNADGLAQYVDWKWPMPASFFNDGANILMARASTITGSDLPGCAGALTSSKNNPMLTPSSGLVQYRVDLSELFRCASALSDNATVEGWTGWTGPFPSYTPIDVQGIHWYIESGGHLPTSAVMWLQVNNPRMSYY